MEGERRHVRAEDDLVRPCIEKASHGYPGSGDQPIGLGAGRVMPMRVCIVVQQVVAHRVYDGLWYLRAARTVEIRNLVAVVLPAQRRKLLANLLSAQLLACRRSDLARGGAHEISAPAHCSRIFAASTWSATSPSSLRAIVNRSATSCVTGTGTLFSRATCAAMPMSLSRRARRKVRGNFRVITRSGNRFMEALERPLDRLITSRAIFGSTPAFFIVTRISAVVHT